MISQSYKIIVTWSKSVPEAKGRELTDIANEWDVSLYDIQTITEIHINQPPTSKDGNNGTFGAGPNQESKSIPFGTKVLETFG